MITKYAPKNYAETRDSMSWALAYAPDFNGEQSLDETFDDLLFGVESVKAKTRSAAKLALIEEVLQKLAESRAFFGSGEIKEAHRERLAIPS